jgi:hypothetical protein
MHPGTVAVQVVPPYGLRLTFEDGTTGFIDCRSRLWRHDAGVFAQLRDPARFAQVFVHPEWGHIEWPNGADWDPDTLYEEAHGGRVA